MASVTRAVVAVLRWTPHAALVLLFLAVVAHALGWQWLANAYGDAIFGLAAIAVVVRRS